MKLGRDTVRRLNRLVEPLNRTHDSEAAAGEAFVEACDAAMRCYDVVIEAAYYNETRETGTESFRHLLLKGKCRVDDSVFVRDVYVHEGGRCEVNAYFS